MAAASVVITKLKLVMASTNVVQIMEYVALAIILGIA